MDVLLKQQSLHIDAFEFVLKNLGKVHNALRYVSILLLLRAIFVDIVEAEDGAFEGKEIYRAKAGDRVKALCSREAIVAAGDLWCSTGTTVIAAFGDVTEHTDFLAELIKKRVHEAKRRLAPCQELTVNEGEHTGKHRCRRGRAALRCRQTQNSLDILNVVKRLTSKLIVIGNDVVIAEQTEVRIGTTLLSELIQWRQIVRVRILEKFIDSFPLIRRLIKDGRESPTAGDDSVGFR